VTASAAGVRVRLVAPDSRYDGCEGVVDAGELAEARKRDTAVSVRLVGADAPGTVAWHDELVVLP
jgi:hypothetical protein